MRDKRRVEDLTIEELEQVLAMRRRQQRQERAALMQRRGRTVARQAPEKQPTSPQQTFDDVVANIAENPSGAPLVQQPEPTPELIFQNDGEAKIDLPTRPDYKRKATNLTRRLTNSTLLVVEVIAVVGLVLLGWQLTQGLTFVEEASNEAQRTLNEARQASIPTLEPTPVLSLNQIVLPGGHTFVEGETPQFNYEEIPENLRFAVREQITQPVIERPAPTDETALRLVVPKLNIDQAIVQGSDWEALKQGVGQVRNGYNPGDEVGNVALTAHNDIYGELFKDLDQLETGDQFQVLTQNEVHLYSITGTDVVEPRDVHVLESQGKATAVLISCYPYRVNTQRIVVFADRIG